MHLNKSSEYTQLKCNTFESKPTKIEEKLLKSKKMMKVTSICKKLNHQCHRLPMVTDETSFSPQGCRQTKFLCQVIYF